MEQISTSIKRESPVQHSPFGRSKYFPHQGKQEIARRLAAYNKRKATK